VRWLPYTSTTFGRGLAPSVLEAKTMAAGTSSAANRAGFSSNFGGVNSRRSSSPSSIPSGTRSRNAHHTLAISSSRILPRRLQFLLYWPLWPDRLLTLATVRAGYEPVLRLLVAFGPVSRVRPLA
jgi:hypothetical protein